MKIQTTLSQTMLVVVMAGIGFAALRDPESFAFDLFKNVTIAMLIYATIRAAWSEKREGAGWLGFAVFGWANLIARGEGQVLVEWLFWKGILLFVTGEQVRNFFNRIWPEFHMNSRGYSVIHFVMTSVSGVAGALLLTFLAPLADRRSEPAHDDGAME